MKDQQGKPLKPGDRVLIEAFVAQTYESQQKEVPVFIAGKSVFVPEHVIRRANPVEVAK